MAIPHYTYMVLKMPGPQGIITVRTDFQGAAECFRVAIQAALTTRDENGRKRSVNTKTITVFIFFIGNKIENGNSGNGNDIGISETSETKVRCGKYTGNGRNLKYDR
jgi:crotonobetainyl-CoA:carnitine CoA-transferase CaiB-like acyl-CoA transferase